MPKQKIAFQGRLGAYSHMACVAQYPKMEPLPCADFDAVFEAVTQGKAQLAMVPVENSTAGRVADVYRLLPETSLHIIGEYLQPIHHCLAAPKGAQLQNITEAHSHLQALNQSHNTLRKLGIKPVEHIDTAGAAEDVASWQDKTKAAVCSKLAAQLYGLTILKENVQDTGHNTTRFLVLSPSPVVPNPQELCLTTFVFQVRNVPAALYKAMGGFATNGINMTKLESYMLDGKFQSTLFYADVEGHPETQAMQHAFEELKFFSKKVKVLGVYPKNRQGN